MMNNVEPDIINTKAVDKVKNLFVINDTRTLNIIKEPISDPDQFLVTCEEARKSGHIIIGFGVSNNDFYALIHNGN